MSLKKWLIAVRPWSLAASTVPALMTITYVYFLKIEYSLEINIFYGFLALIGAGIFQASSNIINDYIDYKHKVDRLESLGGGLYNNRKYNETKIIHNLWIYFINYRYNSWIISNISHRLSFIMDRCYWYFFYYLLHKIQIYRARRFSNFYYLWTNDWPWYCLCYD